MKKHLFTFAIIVCIIFLSSCSLIKRHYTRGYYAGHNSTKSVTNKTKKQITEQKKQPSLYAIQNKLDNIDEINLKPISLTENEAIITSNKKTLEKIIPAAPHKNYVGYNVAKIFQEENAKLVKVKKNDPDSLAADALSLFWIIILILLILWLVAILTGGWGLGDFVHILLVVALILLILWILRII